jgi:hypothetical protein
MFLVAWFGAGFFGLVGLVLIALSVGVRAIGAFVTTELARSLAISYVGLLVYAQASPLLQQRFAWMPAAMIIAITPLVRRETPTTLQAVVPASHKVTA